MQILLTTPSPALPAGFVDLLQAVLETGLVSALLVSRPADMPENGPGAPLQQYQDDIVALAPLTRAANCALLLQDAPGLVRPLGADGVCMNTGDMASSATPFADALETLKPDFIVGAMALQTRHGAMLAGESGADFICFGSPSAAPDPETIRMSQWWSKLFEVPATLFDPLTPVEKLQEFHCEFLGLGPNVWQAPQGPAQALSTLHQRCPVPLTGPQ